MFVSSGNSWAREWSESFERVSYMLEKFKLRYPDAVGSIMGIRIKAFK